MKSGCKSAAALVKLAFGKTPKHRRVGLLVLLIKKQFIATYFRLVNGKASP